ncbi:hypothetical protein VTN00DRAFT_7163 [Thermoascus crustaceus]|uniref:uncharacterized protein n=1 Tax=Thermoascus crustaceus TaxID=5088 RepID=UPI0037448310
MNYPDLDQPIVEEANILDQPTDEAAVREHLADEESVQMEQMAHYLQPARWWLASSAIPLLAGSFGPMANAFSICSLSQHWRFEIPPGQNHRIDIDDPDWVIAINAVSLAAAIISNLSLLMNMARRISFAVAQPITIIGWYISSVLLICLLAVISAHMKLPVNANRALTQAYYYGAIAAAIYFFIASMLIVTMYGAYKGHYSKEFKLTPSQRTLMLQTIIFMVYLLGGAAVYAHVEKWRYLDALYWADFTLFTIGIGEFSPKTHLGRGLLFPYAVGGIINIGLVIGSIRSLMVQKGKKKLTDRLTEKTRRALVKRIFDRNRCSLHLIEKGDECRDMSESDRRKQEFMAMRKVRKIAAAEHRWLSLLISLSAWLMLWLLGAVAFWRSEKNRGWTYFEALYFSYTSLFTIGYGDVYPVSNWAKPFFVFWTLLAVPTVTMVISNVGDTIVRSIRNLTIYLGEVTILPGEKSVTERLKDIFRKGEKEIALEENGEKDPSREDQGNDQDESQAMERVGGVMEAEELREEEIARKRGDIAAENIHHYQYLLVHELRKMFRYVKSGQPKEFGYDEWEYYLRLIGEDESVITYHGNPPEDKDGLSEEERAARGVQESDEREKKARWSWIDHTSPLMGDKDEAEWLLEALAETLEKELKRLSEEYRARQQEEESKEESSNSKKPSTNGE